jgi:hypothetical protein
MDSNHLVAKIVGGVLAFIVLVGVISFVGWDVGWWFSNQNVNRQALQFQHSYGTQSAYIEEVNQEINEFNALQTQIVDPSTAPAEKNALVAQQQAIVNQACGQVGEISITIPTNEKSWANQYCS